MLTFALLRNHKVLRHLRGIIQRHSSDLPKSVLFGGHLKEQLNEESLGRFIYDRLRERSRADKIIQVCAVTGQSMTTQTFLKQSIAVAEGLKEQNIKKGDFVLLVGNNGLNTNISIVGILLLGAVVVPISQYANPGDLKHLLTLIRPKFFICERQTLFMIRRIMNNILGPIDHNSIFLLNNLNHIDTGLRCFRDFTKGKADHWESFIPVEVKTPKEELAFVMKSLADGNAQMGVGLTHYNLLTVLSRYEATKESLNSEVILMVQRIIWMSGIYSLLLSCCFGPKLVVLSDFDEEFFMDAVEKYKITTAFLYPAKIWQLYKYKYPKTYDVSSCRRIFAVGIGVPSVLINLMKEKTGLNVRPAYGKSEMSGIVVEPIRQYKEGSMGHLVPMCYAKVVSSATNENCESNTPGEICFKGPTLMRGYVHDDQATRNVIDKDGFFHTGDYGYYDDEGNIYILDRIREVIRYRNYEISPMEVEGVLKSHDSVKDCVVSGIAHPEDGYRLVAFVVLQNGSTTTADEIAQFIERKLPDHKLLKGGVVFIPKVPRSRETGFIRRNAINKVLSKYRLTTYPKPTKKAESGQTKSGEVQQERTEHAAVEKTSPEVKKIK